MRIRLYGPRGWRNSKCLVLRGVRRQTNRRRNEEIRAVDSALRELLAAMHHVGARLTANGLWMTALIGEITTERFSNMEQQQGENGSRNQRSRTRRKYR
jgi:hypothetical protein